MSCCAKHVRYGTEMIFTDPRMRSPTALGRFGATITPQAVTVLPSSSASSPPAALPQAPADQVALMGGIIADLSNGYTQVKGAINPDLYSNDVLGDVMNSLAVIDTAIQTLSGSGMVSVLSADGAPFTSPAQAWNAWADLATQTQAKIQQLNGYAGTWTLTHVAETVGTRLNPFAPGGILDPGPGGGLPVWAYAIIGVVGLGFVAYISGQVGTIAKVFSGTRTHRRSRRSKR